MDLLASPLIHERAARVRDHRPWPAPDRETLVMARNGHKSAFAGLILSGARPMYVDPYYDEQLEVAHAVLAEDVGQDA